MAFKARKAKSGFFEIHGLEAFIEEKIGELKRAFGLHKKVEPEPKAPVKKAVAGKRAAPVKKQAAEKKPKKDPLADVLAAFDSHPKRDGLIKAGKQKDQLLRSLIPLYVLRDGAEISSGTTSKFWAKHGVTYAAPNVAKALREHTGYARRTAKGQQITAAGIKYVEQALNPKRP